MYVESSFILSLVKNFLLCFMSFEFLIEHVLDTNSALNFALFNYTE